MQDEHCQSSGIIEWKILSHQLLLNLAWLAFLTGSLAAQSTAVDPLFSQTYFQGLRDRGLFELAETLCLQELSSEKIGNSRKQFLHRQLAGTYAAHATALPYTEAIELWEQADRELEQPGFPYYFNGERGILKAARTEQIYWLLLLEPQNKTLKSEFDQLWQEALTLLEWAAEKHSAATQSRSGEADFDVSEAFFRWQLARCDLLLLSAEIDAAAFPLQKLELQKARQLISQLSQTNLPENAQLELRLLELKLLRLERDSVRCQSQFEQLREADFPPEMIQRATAIYARCLLDQNRPAASAELILEIAKKHGPLTAELEAIRLLSLIEMQRLVEEEGNSQLADDLQLEIDRRIKLLESRGDVYFSQLVQKQTGQRALQTRFGNAAGDLLVARQASQNGQFPEAVKHYLMVFDALSQSSNLSAEVDIVPETVRLFTAADKESELSDLLEKVWRSAPAQEGMEQVHLHWAETLGRLSLKNKNQQQVSIYLAALEDHLARYPDKPTADQAHWLLGELQFSRLQVVQALQHYQQITAGSSRYLTSRRRQLECFRWIIQRLTDLQQPTTGWKAGAVEQAQRFQEEIVFNESLSIEQAELWLSAWQLFIECEETTRETKEQKLEQLAKLAAQFRESPFYDEQLRLDWNRVYHRTLIFRGLQAAREGDKQLSSQLLLKELTRLEDPQEQFFVAQQLSQQQWNDPQIEVAMAELVLKLTLPVFQNWQDQPGSLRQRDQLRLLKIRAEAEEQAGRSSKSIELWEQYRKLDTADRTVLLKLSQLLQDCGDEKCLQRHYQLWQDELKRIPAGTDFWLSARYQLAMAARDINNLEEATKILQVSLLLYPELGSPELRQKCENLLADLKAKQP